MSKLALSFFLMIVVLLPLPAASSAQNAPESAGASSAPSAPPADDWTTWDYDPQRTGWNKGETTLTKSNVANLKVQWSTQLPTPVTDVALSTITAPLVVAGVNTPHGRKNMVLLLSANDTLFALDADSGKTLWQKTFPNPIPPQRPATWLCPNTTNDTPVVDKAKNSILFITSDGKLRDLNLSDGKELMTPTQFISPFTRAWSLNLIDNVVYTTSGRACGEVLDPNTEFAAASDPLGTRPFGGGSRPASADGTGSTPPGGGGGARNVPPTGARNVPIDPSAVSAMDLSDLAHPVVTHFFTSGARPGAPWGRGGAAEGPRNTLILETSDGLYDPASGNYGDTILKLAPKATRVLDSFTPENHQYIMAHDLAGSATPVVFPFGGKTLIAVAQKEGVIRLLDADDMGGGPPENHSKPLYSAKIGNDAALGTDPGQGVWGAIATYVDPDGNRFLYLPMWGPPSTSAPPFKSNNGPVPHGSIMAFQVTGDGDKVSLIPQWTSPDLTVPDPPVVANGVVFAYQTGEQTLQNPTINGVRRSAPPSFRATPVSHLILYALDAETGQVLYSSGSIIPNWVHFNEPVVALGKVFIVTHDAHVYAFGLDR